MDEGSPVRRLMNRPLDNMKEGQVFKLVSPLNIDGQDFQLFECLKVLPFVRGKYKDNRVHSRRDYFYKVRSKPVAGGEPEEFYIRIDRGQVIYVPKNSLPFPPEMQ